METKCLHFQTGGHGGPALAGIQNRLNLDFRLAPSHVIAFLTFRFSSVWFSRQRGSGFVENNRLFNSGHMLLCTAEKLMRRTMVSETETEAHGIVKTSTASPPLHSIRFNNPFLTIQKQSKTVCFRFIGIPQTKMTLRNKGLGLSTLKGGLRRRELSQ